MSTKKTVAGSSKGPARKPVPQLAAPKQSKTAVYNGSVQMTNPVERDNKNLLDDEVDENAGGDDDAWSEASQGHGNAPPQLHTMLLDTAFKATLNSLLPSLIPDREKALRDSKELPQIPVGSTPQHSNERASGPLRVVNT